MTDDVPAPPAEGQAAVKSWYEGVEPETVGYIQNKKWDGADGPIKALEGYRNLEKFQGVPPDQIIKLPKADDAEGWGKVYQKLGRPESADKYGDVVVPEGVNVNQDLIKEFDGLFFGQNLTKAQRDSLISGYIEKETAVTSQRQKELELRIANERAQLKNEWGQKHDERVELAKRVVRVGLPEGVDKDATLSAMEEAVGPVVFAKFFANLADKFQISEDKMVNSDGAPGSSYGYTKEQGIADLAKLKASLKADPVRLAMYNKNTGPDIEQLRKLTEFISR